MKPKYCRFCATELTECKFGDTPDERLGCDNDKCPDLIAFRKNVSPSRDGYPKDSLDRVTAPVLYDEETGKKLSEVQK